MNLLPQFGFFELMLVAVIALLVVGPKDLPKLMRSAGRMAAKARAMAAEFTAAFDQMAREADMEEMRAEIEALKKDNVFSNAKKSIEDAIAPAENELRDEMREVNKAASQTSGKPETPAAPAAHEGQTGDEGRADDDGPARS